MQGKKNYSEKLFTSFQLSDRVPVDNIYRLLLKELDLRFLYKETAQYYGTEGQLSIDPVVFFKLLLVGYLENINSDRRIIAFASMRLDVLYFLGYDIDEELPWHSTLSRTRQLYGVEIFAKLFKMVLSLCIKKGMVRGKRQAIDSAFVKANASLDSLTEKPVLNVFEQEILADFDAYVNEFSDDDSLNIKPCAESPSDKSTPYVSEQKHSEVEQHHDWKRNEYKDQPGHNKLDKLDEFGNLIRPRYLSNHTHYSPTDQDARIAVKPGKSRQMNYYAQVAVDQAHHVITCAVADFADKRDSECLAFLLDNTITNLADEGIVLEQIIADAGYSSGEALKYCEQKQIDAYIPNFGQYKNSREGFIYNKDLNQYECTRANKAVLPFRKTITDSKGYTKNIYRSNNSKCKNCPLRKECIGTSDFKKIEDSIHKPLYDKMHTKLQTKYAKRLLKQRSSTVEPVLGTLSNFLNLKRTNARGIKQANKHVIMSAIAYNVKKYLKFVNKVRVSACAQLKKRTAINKINEVFNILSISFSGNRNSHPNLFNLS